MQLLETTTVFSVYPYEGTSYVMKEANFPFFWP